MEFLYKDKTYEVNSGFWTAFLYRATYGESIINIFDDTNSQIIKLIYLLHTGITSKKKPCVEELMQEAIQAESYIISFCIKLYQEITKSDKAAEKYIKEKVSAGNSDEDEFDIIIAFGHSGLGERLLDVLSLPQLAAIITGFFKDSKRETEYKEMNNDDLALIYGL